MLDTTALADAQRRDANRKYVQTAIKIAAEFTRCNHLAVGRFDNRTNEVSHFSRGLKNIAVDRKIPIVALSQFKRVGEVPRRQQMSDLRESGSIEQVANG